MKEGSEVSEHEFIELMRRVLPIDSLKDIMPEESERLFMAISRLPDCSLLLWEFHQIEINKGFTVTGHPTIPGPSGPFVENMLSRGDSQADFSQLEDFDVGRDSSQ